MSERLARSPLQRYQEAQNALRNATDGEIDTHHLAKLCAIRDHVRDFVSPNSECGFSKEIAFEILNELESIFKGHSPTLFKVARSRGGRGRTREEASAISDAKTYYLAAEAGVVDDKHAVMTILKHFGGQRTGGLHEKTVRGWIADPKIKTRCIEDIDDPTLVIDFMKFSGRFYNQNFLKVDKSYRKQRHASHSAETGSDECD